MANLPRIGLVVWGIVLGCGEAPSNVPVAVTGCEGDDPSDGATVVMVIDTLTFGRREGEIAPGFDLDDRVSDSADAGGCYKPDLTSPEGVPGIDSAFSSLVPALEATEAIAVEGLVEDSIKSGELLITVEITDVDDELNDACVGLTIGQALGPAPLGTDGELEAWWTWEWDTASPSATISGAQMVNGRIDAGKFDISIPLQVLDASIDLPIRGTEVRIDRVEEGRGVGFVAGGLDLVDLTELAMSVGSDVGPVVASLASAGADLLPDSSGACQQLSIVLEYEATPGFLFE